MAHQYSGVSGKGCRLHLFQLQCLHLFCALVQTEGLSFIYHSKKRVLLNQLQSTLRLPIIVLLLNFRALRGQWGEDEGHLPPAVTFVKRWSVQLQALQKMFFSLFTTTLIYGTALLSQVGLWDVQLSRLISRFCLTNLQILAVNCPLWLTMFDFICLYRVSTWNSSIAGRHLFFTLLYLPQNTEKP